MHTKHENVTPESALHRRFGKPPGAFRSPWPAAPENVGDEYVFRTRISLTCRSLPEK